MILSLSLSLLSNKNFETSEMEDERDQLGQEVCDIGGFSKGQ